MQLNYNIVCGPQESHGEKRCEIQIKWQLRNGWDIIRKLMAKILIATI